jgi:hypothetical protein
VAVGFSAQAQQFSKTEYISLILLGLDGGKRVNVVQKTSCKPWSHDLSEVIKADECKLLQRGLL